MNNISGGRFSLKLLNLLGLWSMTNNNSSALSTLRWWLLRLLHFPLSFTLTALMIIEMVISKSLDDATDVVYVTLTEIAFVIKLISIWKRSEHLNYYIGQITNANEFALRTEVEKRFWQQKQNTFSRFAKLYQFFCFATVFSAYLNILFGINYEIPFAYYVPFEWRTNHYWYAVGYNCLATFWTSTACGCLDMSICYFLYHLSLLYKVLGMRFLTLQDRSEKEAVKELIRIFKMHQNIRKLTICCEIVISLPVLSQIVLSALVICFTGYRMQNMDVMQNFGQFVTMLQFLGVMIFQIFLPCYYANEITVNSNQLTTNVYSMDWHEYSIPTRKMIFTYMESLKRPTKLKAGGYFEIGLPIFTKTINNAYSFFALLLNVSK